MRIVFLQDDFPPLALGGSGAVAFRLAKAIKERGHDVYVITAVQNKSDEGRAEYEGLKIFKIYSSYQERWRAYLSLYNPYTVKKVKKIISEIIPDIVHAHNIHLHLSYHCLKIAKKYGARVFLTAHDVMLFNYGKLTEFIDPENLSCPTSFNYRVSPWQQIKKYKFRYNPLRNIIIRYYLQYTDKIIAVSEALKDALSQNEIKNITVINNGIDANDWDVSPAIISEFKSRHGLVGKKIILFCGRLSAAKGGEMAIKMLEQLIKIVPESILFVVGEKNEYAQKMLTIAGTADLSRHVLFSGWLKGNELKAAYAVCDIVVVPSICFDSFPTVILEAMACSKPVIASCFGGAREIIENNVNGYLANPFDINYITERIAKIFKNNEDEGKVGTNGRKRVEKIFNIEKTSGKYLELYN